MKKYIGTKTIKAEPMAKSDAEKVLNRSLADTKGGEEGYLVEYSDGYKSWSPKETFEAAYKIAETYLDRMRIEYDEVKERLMKLYSFQMSEECRALPQKKQDELCAQRYAMSSYMTVLGHRIDNAKMEQKQHEAEQKMSAGINGLCYLTKAGKCDFCPDESDNCKKLILADGSYICVRPVHMDESIK